MPPLRMPHHATLCSSCLNCQSNFRLKVFLLFLTPTAISFFVYSFFCFSHASILPDFLNWLFTLPPLHMPPHATLCSSSRVPAVVFQQSCSSFVFQHSCSIICDCICVAASVFTFVLQFAFVLQHLCSHLCCSICVRICVAASVFQLLCSCLCSP